MSATTTLSARPGTGGTAGRAARTRRRTPWVVGAGMLLVLVVVSVLTRDSARFDGALDPRNPGRDGAQALARVLDAHGAPVTVARGQDQLLATPVDAGTTVVVTDPGELGPSTLRTLRRHADGAAALVLVGPAATLAALLDVDTSGAVTGTRTAGCDTPLVRGLSLRARDADGLDGLDGTGCFGATLGRVGGTWTLSSPGSLANTHLREADNAAVGLRLLGQGDSVLWYVADSADTPADDGVDLAGLLPPWLVPSLLLLSAALVALVLWRGRRLGPLVTEPLPVVVRAVESTRSRGRLYRRTADRQHVADVLAGATRRRLLEVLGLPRSTRTEALVAAVAARTGRDPREVHDLLTGSTSGAAGSRKDAPLVGLGPRLLELEDEVRSP
ncbi:DUF4350 domain-containing protein [Nocardioides korecus]